MLYNFFSFQFWSDYFFKAPQDALVKTLVRNGVDTYMYVQNTTVEALRCGIISLSDQKKLI